jgi:hypothetical protein
MLYLAIKAGISGILVAIASEVARRYPGIGGMIASLPLVSILAMIWLYRDTDDPVAIAQHANATFWYVLPSLPMFLLVPWLIGRGWGFWPALVAGCVITALFYVLMNRMLAHYQIA